MTWIKTATATFDQNEIVAVQYLPNNYSRTHDELVVSMRGGAQLTFSGDEATQLWDRLSEIGAVSTSDG